MKLVDLNKMVKNRKTTLITNSISVTDNVYHNGRGGEGRGFSATFR